MIVLGVVLLVLAAILVAPFLLIWALNTLFSLSIAYTGWNLLAALVLVCLTRPFVDYSKK